MRGSSPRMTSWNSHAPNHPAAPHARGFALKPHPPKIRGRREDRVRAAPAVSCAMLQKRVAPEHTGLAEASGLPCAMALRLIRFRPGDRLSCHHRLWKLSLTANLTPAPGRRTRTISPYATAALVSRSLRVHRSLPLVCDDGQRPSGGTGCGSRKSDLPDEASGKFWKEGLDRFW
jgi:hypothetical protein